jgi:hypothetical protein
MEKLKEWKCVSCTRCVNFGIVDKAEGCVLKKKKLSETSVCPSLDCFKERILYINNDGTYGDPINSEYEYMLMLGLER